MKKVLMMILLTGITFAENINIKESILPNIKAWQPLMLDYRNKNLVIAFNQNKITNKIFLSIISIGICTSDLFKTLDKVNKIVILNKHAEQGYIFNNKNNKCKQSSNYKNKQKEFFLLGNSRIY